jgi:hypothetical protein
METLNSQGQERRVIERRCQSDRRSTLRWHPDGGDRRYGNGRRKDDKWDTLKAVLTRLFQVQGDLGWRGRRSKND